MLLIFTKNLLIISYIFLLLNVWTSEFQFKRLFPPALYQIMPSLRCVAVERAAARWSRGLARFVHTPDAHFGTIDALRLFRADQKLFCLSGARDRQIALWDLVNIAQILIWKYFYRLTRGYRGVEIFFHFVKIIKINTLIFFRLR